jgi:Ran GTPase-activating protein (RanGAP) involved in mRNA processing and transport
MHSLTELDLSEAGSYGRYGEDPVVDVSGMEGLAGWPGLARLRSLTLSGNDVRQNGLRALLRSPRVVGLKELTLRNNELEGGAMEEFRMARPELRLDVLNVGENILEDVGAAYLAGAACLCELKALELDRCEIVTPHGGSALAKAVFIDSLHRLSLNHNGLSTEGLGALLAADFLSLHTLELFDNGVDDEGATLLANSPASDTLVELDLRGGNLRSDGVVALAESAHLRNLLVLRLNENPIQKAAEAILTSSPLAKRLAVLEISPWRDEDIAF